MKASHRPALPAIFLDRDGTINYDHGWLTSPEQVQLLAGSAEAIRAINESGRLAVVITNQPVIARGECTEQGLREIHNKLEWLLERENAFLDGIYFCPHHPDSGFEGERPELKIPCSCRKPATGLFEAAVRDLNIDVTRSWMIGDKKCDVEAAAAFGIRSVLVARNQKEFDTTITGEPTIRSKTLEDAVSEILATDLE